MAEKKLVQTWVSAEVYERLCKLADQEQRSMANLIRVLIDKGLEAQKVKGR